MRIYLVGFMGSGKSGTGKKIASKLDYSFVELDAMIESVEKKTVREIFNKEGEEYFRRLESQLLHATILQKKAVISCGGGTPCYFDNMDWMNERGITVYLKMNPETLFGRLRNNRDKRPLIAKLSDAQLKDFIFQKLSEREAFYLQAQCVVEPEKMKVKEIAEMIAKQIGKKKTESKN